MSSKEQVTVTSDVQDSTSDLLVTPSGPDTETRLRLSSDRASFLARVSRTVGGSMQTDRAVELILDMLVPEVVDWAQVVLREAGLLRCHAMLAGGPVERADVPAPRLGTSTLSRVMARGLRELSLVALGGGEMDNRALASAVPAPELRESVNSLRPADLLVLPLTARGRAFGALTVARRGNDGFDQDAIAFLEELTESLAVTLDATRTLADSRRVAGVLSRDLAPPDLPQMSGARLATYYRVAFEHEALGGDFYDVHGSDDDWTAVVGDVCGKGVEAAVLTGKVRQAVRTAALVDRSPSRVLDLVNRVLVSEGEGTFVTALCARVRRRGEDLAVSVAAAGHPPPYVIRSSGGLDRPEAEGTVLGLFDTHDYSETEIVLHPGDICLFFTDGVLEAPGFDEQFGEDRLHRVLVDAPRSDANAVVEAVAMTLAAHIGDRAHDDIAILGVQNVPDAR
ncbi:MAG TPA: GAF domain-containing SpoIIE family protein phosphatase [Nocardioidaceae bacterium]|nr:GAF domain-containing SpoIIE family protein phosphatase [Nocardioidaceae bacterium]